MDKYFKKSAGIPLQTLTLFRVILLGTLVTTILLSSCKEKNKNTVATVKKDVYYTCSMHPQVHEEHPGDCPICGMKLLAVPMASIGNTSQIQLSSEQIELGNIHTDTVGTESIGDKEILAGTLNFNEEKLSSLNARVEGRVDKLYFKDIGSYVKKGEKLYDLYSEQLNNSKSEYINALQQQNLAGSSLINYAALVESAKNKLFLWGMTNDQIGQLTQDGQTSSQTAFYSTETGYITALNVKEGDYVMEGGPVMQLANLSTLWAEAQVYETQMSYISKSEKVSVQIPDLNNQIIEGTIDFVNPEANPDARINLVRVTIENKGNQLHPGMLVYIIVSNRQHNSIILPENAILTDSKGSAVWVQTKPGVFEVRMVKTGITENDAVEVTSGVKRGDVVVTSGAYLLNSEYIFEHGSSPMAGMKM